MAVSVGAIVGTLDLNDKATAKFGKFFNTLDSVSGKMAAAGGIMSGLSLGLNGVAAAAVKAAGDWEQTKIAFTTMLGSAEKAGTFLKEMQDFAAATPFELPGLIEGARRMMAMGFTAQQVKPMLTAVGDAVAGLGLGQEGIQRVTLALGQMQAKGKVSGEEMRQLAEAGIPAWQFLAEKIGKDIPAAMKLSEKGAIDAQTAIAAITEGMAKKFGGMMEQQSKTFLGQMSTLKDEFGFVLRDFGTALMPVAQAGMEAMQKLLPVVRSVGQAFAEMNPTVRTTGVIMVGIVTSLGPILLGFAAFVKTVAGVSAAFATAKAAMFAFGNLVPVLTVRIAAMNAAAAVTSTLLGKIAVVGAAAWIGWEIGKLIDQTFDLSKKIGNLIVGLETIKSLEKGSGGAGALRLGIDATQFESMDKWQSAVKKQIASNAALASSHGVVATGAKKVTAATDDQIRSMVKGLKDADTMKKAQEILGRQAVSLAEAQRVVSISTAMASKALSEEAKAAKEAADRMKDLKEQWSAFGRAREILFQANALPGQKSLDPFFGITPEGLQSLSSASLEAVATAERLASAREILFAAGQAPGQQSLDPFAGINMPGLATGISPESMKRIGVPAGVSLGKSLKDSFKGALADLPSVVMGALQGGGNVGKAVGGLFGGALGQTLGEGLKKSIGGTLGKVLGGALPGIGTIAGGLLGGLADKLFGGGEGAKVNDLRDQFIAAQGGLAALGQKAKEVGLDLNALLKADKVNEFEAAVKGLTSAWDAQRQKQEDLKNGMNGVKEAMDRYGISVNEMGPAWQQQDMDGKTSQLLRDVQLLNAAQADHTAMIEKMGPAFQDVVTQARATGATIPEALRPMIEEMIKAGKIVDENGKAFENTEAAGISFSQTLSESMQSVADDVKRLVDAILGINNIKINPIHVPVTVDTPAGIPGGMPAIKMPDPVPMGKGAVVTKPTLGLVGEAGPEVVAPVHEFKRMVEDFAGMHGGSGDMARAVVQLGDKVLVDAIVELIRDNKHDARTKIQGRR
jgi:tape measure domain-containing protein